MIKRILTAAAIATLVAAPAADAKPSKHRTATAHAALATGSGIAQPDRPAGVAVVRGACPSAPDVAGCAINDTIYINRGGRMTVEHELGHVYSARYLDDAERAWFERVARTAPWFELQGPDGAFLTRASGEEQFADAYAHCRLGDDTAGFRLANGGVRFSWEQSTPYRPTPRTLRRICSFIANAM